MTSVTTTTTLMTPTAMASHLYDFDEIERSQTSAKPTQKRINNRCSGCRSCVMTEGSTTPNAKKVARAPTMPRTGILAVHEDEDVEVSFKVPSVRFPTRMSVMT